MSKKILVKDAKEHNLKSCNPEIEHNSITIFTGVSGSGKSSLAVDTIAREGQRLYLETLPSYSRKFINKLSKPSVGEITGLRATVLLGQKRLSGNQKSTVGTITDLYDFLRLLFARLGVYKGDREDFKLSKSLFSFNTEKGMCKNCGGTGLKEIISPALLIKDENLSLGEGALIPTTPTGYIVYSQVTLDVLNRVCNAHGFNIDIPWKELSDYERNIIFYGSEKIKIPFGKHTLESRMKWSGITAKPREEGYYRGIINIMSEILKRDRNKNILRFAKTEKCPICEGERLNEDARQVFFHKNNISYYSGLSIAELKEFLTDTNFKGKEKEFINSIRPEIINKINRLESLGLSYLSLDRESTSLSGGELQRIKLATQTGGDLSGILFVFDEPSAGLHQRDSMRLFNILEEIRNNGNTICLVEHDRDIILRADKIIDLGPFAGVNGGEIVFADNPRNISRYVDKSQTASYLLNSKIHINRKRKENGKYLKICGASKFNIKGLDVSFKLNALNTVTGVSGAGKTTLVKRILGVYARDFIKRGVEIKELVTNIEGLEEFSDIIEIDDKPIGRTSRSNPATYIKLFDLIRDLFSKLPEAKEKNLKKSDFSFNVKGGRCEECQGAGIKSTGMLFMGDIKIVCNVCKGKRFTERILDIKYRGKNIYDVLEMSFDEASLFFADFPEIKRIIETAVSLGLGYIKLGQPATTISGGEAQRVKLISRLSKKTKGRSLYIFDEPTIGLSDYDIQIFLDTVNKLIIGGDTVIIIEHNLDIIKQSDHIVDLGPEGGKEGGKLVVEGDLRDIISCKNSYTGRALINSEKTQPEKTAKISDNAEEIYLQGVFTNNLKNINVRIPKNRFTVITGVSGSGKSSLAFDTIYAASHRKFLERLSVYARQSLKSLPKPDYILSRGLTPAIGIKQNIYSDNPRSTIGTISGIYDLYRLLFSRAGLDENGKPSILLSEDFSFNNNIGACENCKGLGIINTLDPDLLINNPELPLFNGAMSRTQTGRFYGDEFGQYRATLFAVGKKHGYDYHKPVNELTREEFDIAMNGCGEEIFTVNWEYKRKNRTGSFKMKQAWKGFVNLINEEYKRKMMQTRGEKIKELMKEISCPVCRGKRLKENSLKIKFLNLDISDLSELSVKNTLELFKKKKRTIEKSPIAKILSDEIEKKLKLIADAGIDYLSCSRRIDSISHGEYRRLQLAVQMLNGLQDMTFVLDEPTQGLHPRDVKRIIGIIDKLKKNNTVIAVEHDIDIIKSADNIIDLGPNGGMRGGEIIAEGSPKDIADNKNSITGKYLKQKHIKINPKKKHKRKKEFQLKNINFRNIEGQDVRIPRNSLVVITGVSGSGKSSLIEVISESLIKGKPRYCKELLGDYFFDEIISVNQSIGGINHNSNPVIFTGIFDLIKDYFANSDEAKLANLGKKYFSFNSKEGQCPVCKGRGRIKISMDFLSDISAICDECGGKKYKREVLDFKIRNISISDVLGMTVEEAFVFFKDEIKIKDRLNSIIKIGLGYLKTGQDLNTLSGGEIQRLKIVRELIKSDNGKEKLFIMDEPTTGLHPNDVEKLLSVFSELVDAGNSLIIVEHDIFTISNADYIIDLGPEGGDKGGKIIYSGSPDKIADCYLSHTGKFILA